MKRLLNFRIAAATVLMFFLLLESNYSQVSGFVRDQLSQTPIPDALVTLQTTNIQTTTDVDGSFTLINATGENLVIVSAKKGYYNSSVIVNSPVSNAEILIEAVPQDDNPNYNFKDPNVCGTCHPDQLDQWTGSPMSRAGTNKWVYDTYNGTGTPGGMGGFVYTRDSFLAGTNPESECASCHQPEPWVKNPFTALEAIDSLSTGSLHGISCEVCHKIAHLDESKPNYPGIYPGVVTLTRPYAQSSQVEYGVLGDADFNLFSLMRPSYQPQMTAVICAACHQDKNDPDDDGEFEEENGVISEPTYLEWLDSPYSDPQSSNYATCVDCHMPSYGATLVCSEINLPRDPNTIRGHRIEGTTPAFLENAVELNMSPQQSGNEVNVEITVTNNGTGHHVPTGVTIRNMILLVEAWTKNDSTPLNYIGNQAIHELGGIGDPAQGYYSGLAGKFFAKVNHDSSGSGPTFFTDATGIIFDNRIPALHTDTTQYVFELPQVGEEYVIRARLIYRRSFRFLVDAKQWVNDGHDNPLEDILPPYYGHLMEEEIWESSVNSVTNIQMVNFALEQNFPNPFNPSTKISWQSPVGGWQSLKVYDILGNEVAKLVDEYKPAGSYEVEFNSHSGSIQNLTSGVYFYQLKSTPIGGHTGGFIETKKMILLK